MIKYDLTKPDHWLEMVIYFGLGVFFGGLITAFCMWFTPVGPHTAWNLIVSGALGAGLWSAFLGGGLDSISGEAAVHKKGQDGNEWKQVN